MWATCSNVLVKYIYIYIYIYVNSLQVLWKEWCLLYKYVQEITYSCFHKNSWWFRNLCFLSLYNCPVQQLFLRYLQEMTMQFLPSPDHPFLSFIQKLLYKTMIPAHMKQSFLFFLFYFYITLLYLGKHVDVTVLLPQTWNLHVLNLPILQQICVLLISNLYFRPLNLPSNLNLPILQCI